MVLSISLLIVLIVISLSFVVYTQLDASVLDQMSSAARDMAVVIARMEAVQEGLYQGVSPEVTQALIEPIRRDTRYQYIILMDMEGRQFSYPAAGGLGMPYKNGAEEEVLSSGRGYVLADTNELMSAIRAFEPVFYQEKQVGAVLVGLLTDQTRLESEEHKHSLEIALVVSIVAGLIMAYFLSLSIKKSIFGLEPKEIALLLSEKEIILQSLERGVIAVDEKGRVILCNKRAKAMLQLPDAIEKTPLAVHSQELSDRLSKAMATAEGCENDTLFIGAPDTVVINICLIRDPKNLVAGAVASIEDLGEVRAFAEEITDYRTLVDSLRAQNHEFMNRLHSLSGLMQLGHFKEAQDYIITLSDSGSSLERLLTEQIRDHKVAGLLLSKYHQFMERHVNLEICSQSQLLRRPPCLSEEALCSILGNLIDNSFESLSGTDLKEKRISLYIQSEGESLEIEVYNNGPEITEAVASDMFTRGFSTKEKGHGIGLSLIRQILEKCHGVIDFQNDKGVVWHVNIPFDQGHGGRG
jgi:two-component system CitB family sensor kinase